MTDQRARLSLEYGGVDTTAVEAEDSWEMCGIGYVGRDFGSRRRHLKDVFETEATV